MKIYYQDQFVTILHGSCLDTNLKDITGIVTDPPYELSFMGRKWDGTGISFQPDTWRVLKECCKPGSMLLSFGGSRTFHRIAVAIEDAGWEFRDTIMWLYGSGFPKSLDISKAIDKQAGAEREVIGKYHIPSDSDAGNAGKVVRSVTQDGGCFGATAGKEGTVITQPSTPEAQLWSGYGTALKPAFEPILVCMNPLDGTFANNALKHGVAGLNIDGCRVEVNGDDINHRIPSVPYTGKHFGEWRGGDGRVIKHNIDNESTGRPTPNLTMKGRFPANIIHDGSEEVTGLFPNGHARGNKTAKNFKGGDYNVDFGQGSGYMECGKPYDAGSAARFFKKCEYSLVDLCLAQSYDTMNICKNIYVATAERLLAIIQVTTENIALLSVGDWQDVQSDQLVKSAVSHADTCEIVTALVVAGIKNLGSNSEVLQVMRDYTGNSKECIQLLSLVSSAEIQANTDITQITASLLKSFGYVNPAITNYTQEIRRSEPTRFLYSPKANKSERNKGCEELDDNFVGHANQSGRRYGGGNRENWQDPYKRPVAKNDHPTVKPLALMEYLVKLIRPPEDALILDPFMGSGTTLLACKQLGIKCIGIELDESSCEIAAKRCQSINQEEVN